MDYAIRAKLFAAVAALGLGLLAAPHADAASQCKTLKLLPGVVQVYATVDGAAAGDSAFCTADFACPTGSTKVEVFGTALATTRDAVIAVDNTANLSSGEQVSSNCIATVVGNGKRVSVSTCNAKAEAPANKGTADTSACSVYAESPAGARVGANATCFCGT
ncbi:hypothetical protein [Lysobacter enzymogenes]|uniref:Uncharacterized protein n=1 Tax=Lysobacter enzymogenes TaxID=69 RepID=A0A0S2DH73_LYSEN|nr:hypothetical protein [Lysobacter enzymogenes]ALN57688.1 hypothetical protein GLE_2339 [Lysobacter enzymogenes]QCW26241.1 hypothetical protein FE772_11725 [Lysobacter enzymogenes]QQP99180.1 hypothetical protein JHW41_13670 [Lysobacter enzymogenes]